MSDTLIHLDRNSELSLQDQIRSRIVDAIIKGVLQPASRLPSTRGLARQLEVSRNTVVLAYEQLIDEGYLVSRSRSGIFVHDHATPGKPPASETHQPKTAHKSSAQDWDQYFRRRSVDMERPDWLTNWQHHPFPFIDGLFDASLYPVAQWREASRLALGTRFLGNESYAGNLADDPELIEQIRSKMLPRRGITATPDEILITSGRQNALYLVSQLLVNSSTRVSMEEPGNPRWRQLAELAGSEPRGCPVDQHGLMLTEDLCNADVIYVTPSHQVPTAVTMPNERRHALLEQADRFNQLIVEDDFEHENNFLGHPHPALRGMHGGHRVVYVSGLPAVMAPGLKVGFIVADPAFIREARRLRQLVIGRPSLITQRTAAHFLKLGHYDALMARTHRVMAERWDALRQALNHYHRNSAIELPTSGGTSLWIECPDGVNVEDLVNEAQRAGILIEHDAAYHAGGGQPRNHFRMGVTSLPAERIREGVERLEKLTRGLAGDHLERLSPDNPHALGQTQLEQLMPGATIHYKTFYGVPCTIILHADGRMSGRSGHEGEDTDRGQWWIEDGLYCRQWETWGYGEISRLQVTLEDSLIRWWRPAGRLVDTALIRLADD